MKRAIFIGVFFVLFSQVCVGQWKKLNQFSGDVISIFFLDSDPSIGFVGLANSEVWKTTDKGSIWRKTTQNGNGKAYSFTFKNQFEGWFCGLPGNIYRTIDGGELWSELPSGAMSIFYVPLINRLIGGGDGCAYVSSTDGINFLDNYLPRTNYSLNVVFGDNQNGIISSYGADNIVLLTSDGGLSWREVDLEGDLYQPVAIKGSSDYYAIREAGLNNNTGEFLHSSDAGQTWQIIYKYWDSSYLSVTGCVQYGVDRSLFFQTAFDNSEGIMMSLDSGKTFYSVCGPTNEVDTKFYVRDSFIYAGDTHGGLWLNTTGIGSNSTPQLSKDTISLSSEFCNVREDTLIFTLFDSCNCRQAELLEASVSGSNRFSVAGGTVPRTIVPNDTVRIIYTPDPNSSATDNATLNLKLKLGWKVFDTVITLTGKNISPHQDISFTPVLTANNLIAGKEAECNIFSSNRIQDRGLDKVTFDLTYDNDLLEVAEITAQAGMSATYTAPIVTNGIARQPITITGNNMTIDSLLPMVSVKFRTFLTDTTLSTIELSTINLNDDNPDYKNCTLSATGNSTTFTQASICGDSTIRSFMLTGKLIDILSIRPNPTNEDATVSFESLANDKAQLQLIDELGKVVLEETLSTKRGANEHTIAIPKHWSGTFFVRLQIGKDVVTGKLVKQ